MFTWNFQYISRSRLAETFDQLMLDTKKGDILIRIHTAIHDEEEAVELARFVAKLVPGAHIFGTSTSAVICWGKLISNQCVVSVTQMNGGSIRTAMLPTFSEGGVPISPDVLSQNVKQAVVGDDIAAAISGERFESTTSYATGVQTIGEELEITDTFLTCILSVNGKDAASQYRLGIGDELRANPELTNLFPYVYSDASDIPIFVRFSDDCSLSELFDSSSYAGSELYEKHKDIDTAKKRELINANHNVKVGKKLKRAFIYDQKVISDNRQLFRLVEGFPKAETLFGYSCIARSMIYANCVKWEISAYENSNMCGCITEGEIAHVNGRNTFANCSFVVSAMGEGEFTQKYNPYVFSHTDSLMADNTDLLNYLYEIENRFADSEHSDEADSLRQLVKDMRDSFAAVGIEDIVIKRHGALGLNTEAYSIDGDISKLPDEFGWH